MVKHKQEGARSEHCTLRQLQQAVWQFADAKRQQRKIFALWIDTTNAFGSVNHQVIWSILRAYGLPGTDVDFLEKLCAGSKFSIVRPFRQSAEIRTHAGVGQGEITSPLIWNLIVNVLLRYLHGAQQGYVHSSGVMTSALAYIDDAALFSDTQCGFRALIHCLNSFYAWAGLKINNTKCTIFAHDFGTGRALATDHHHINGRPIPTISEHQTYKYLRMELAPGGSWAVEKQRVWGSMQECVLALKGSLYLPHQLDQVMGACLFPVFRYGAALVNWTNAELDMITNKWAQARRLAWKLAH